MFLTSKKFLKSPKISIDCETISNLMRKFRDNNRSMLVPPLFERYCICVTDSSNINYVQYLAPERMKIEVYVGNHRAILVIVDFNKYNDDENSVELQINYSERYANAEKDKQKRIDTANGVVACVLAVSDYMLHYREDVITTAALDAKNNSHKSKKLRNPSNSIYLKPTKHEYFIGHNEFKTQRRCISAAWNVRGHYQRCGQNRVMRYIKPNVHHRKNLKGNAETAEAKNYKI